MILCTGHIQTIASYLVINTRKRKDTWEKEVRKKKQNNEEKDVYYDY